jgi:AcrR family transcriptional regulator
LPRISAAHEQQVRDRIVAAAVRVFSDKGFHSSTIADVCRESGLSVGAIYTYFPSKEALFRQSCDLIAARGLDELAERLAGASHTAERLAIARLYIEAIDEYAGALAGLVAGGRGGREPGVRDAGCQRGAAGRRGPVPHRAGELPAGSARDAVTAFQAARRAAVQNAAGAPRPADAKTGGGMVELLLARAHPADPAGGRATA